jgi:cation:H+ antiporter
VSEPLLALLFVLGAAVSVVASFRLVASLERIGTRLGITQALLGMLAALAGDAPEITAAVSALASHQGKIGAGVAIGSNVFNLAALLGLAALVAGRVPLHRRVVALEGAVAVWIALACMLVVVGALPALAGLPLVLVVLVPYVIFLGASRERLARMGVPASWLSWLGIAIAEQEAELASERPVDQLPVSAAGRSALRRDTAVVALGVVVVVAASVVMERAAQRLGARAGVAQIITGGLVLAVVTSIPNAVAAIYLARRHRAGATLSTAMNSNALNVTFGLLLPATIAGLGSPSATATLVAASYLGLTVIALGLAHRGHGLRRPQGALIIALYLAFVVALTLVS